MDLISKLVNIYYLSNDPNEKVNCNMKNFKEEFKVPDEERKGKTYYEMSVLESCDSLQRGTKKNFCSTEHFILKYAISIIFLKEICYFRKKK